MNHFASWAARATLVGALSVAPMVVWSGTPWEAKVEPELLLTLQTGADADVLVDFVAGTDLSPADAIADPVAKRSWVKAALEATANGSQTDARTLLDNLAISYRSFWISNALAVTTDLATVQLLAQLPTVDYVYGSRPSGAPLPRDDAPPAKMEMVQQGLDVIRAREVWSEGFRGQGVVIGDHDTGVDWQHPALLGKYGGWDGQNADHDYSWRNAFAPADPFCADPEVPCDPHDHGTHTTGTIVGDDGQGNIIGVAPDAKWVACRSLYDPVLGLGSPNTYLDCMEWTIAPYPYQQPELADPARGPQIVNNSWGCLEACPPTLLQDADEAVKYAGILQVVSAGNEGSQCSTIAFPLGIYASSFTVGATNYLDQMAGFSSRGPVLSDASMRLKPNVTAPGVSVRSSVGGGGYSSFSGTSMSAPHVSGAAALLMSAEPRLKGRVDDMRRLLQHTAVPIQTTQTCGGTDMNDIPNNIFGHGRIDAMAAYQALPRLVLEILATGDASGGATHRLSTTLSAASALTATNPRVAVSLPQGVELISASEAVVEQIDIPAAGTVLRFGTASIEAGGSWDVELQLSEAQVALSGSVEADQVSAVPGVPAMAEPEVPPRSAPVGNTPNLTGAGGSLGIWLLMLGVMLAGVRRSRA